MSALRLRQFKNDYEEDLDYEYSHDETEDFSDCSSEYFSHSSEFNDESDNDPTPKTLRRELVDYNKSERKVCTKKGWRRYFFPKHLYKWRLRSFDHVFNIRRKNFREKRFKSGDSKKEVVDKSFEEETQFISEISVVINNDLQVKNVKYDSLSTPFVDYTTYTSSVT